MTVQRVVKVAVTDGGDAWVDGARLASEPGRSAAQARAAALRVVAEMADEGRPLRVDASEPDGTLWRLVVHGDGRVEDAAQASQRAGDPVARTVPEDYQAQRDVIVAACQAGRTAVAAVLAESLCQQAADEHGRTHPYALQARELHGVALLQDGDAAGACEAYVAAARGWAGQNRTAYQEALRRAYACWQRVDDTSGVWLGEQVVAVVRLGGEDVSDMLRAALTRLDRLRSGVSV
ncbi:hypothetical protein [Streptomyces sp. NEAU-S7GS2]|uniref:hypothetical protein n=1 Tax=Streptomyces sp. NEAU-S7GS2 TaxID=2202000 RepID=UPI000D6EC919|nr:hypothetical protein [Streptomyces sp. NEAU-S7GS2]AWN32624.1 hypothetical protein DKG71_42360 [Streptomyces sp. NEAU-S7GS2]